MIIVTIIITITILRIILTIVVIVKIPEGFLVTQPFGSSKAIARDQQGLNKGPLRSRVGSRDSVLKGCYRFACKAFVPKASRILVGFSMDPKALYRVGVMAWGC